MSKKYNFRQTKFITSAPDINHLPPHGVEIAFAGCSNAGKSSALNKLTDQKNLARTSKTPGRTQLINMFEVEKGCNLMDLPGYGFAKVPEELKIQWQEALGEYLQTRENLIGLVLFMDIRHPLKDTDLSMIHWAVDSELPVLALLTKCDKLKRGPAKSAVLQVRRALEPLGGDVQVESFSSLKGEGVDTVRSVLSGWFHAGRRKR